METVKLPLVTPQQAAPAVISSLRDASMGAAVVERAGALFLTYASDLGAAGDVLVRDLPDRAFERLGSPTRAAIGDLEKSRFEPGPLLSVDQVRFGLVTAMFAGVRVSHNEALVISRHESGAHGLYGPTICEANSSHVFPRPSLVDGALCPCKSHLGLRVRPRVHWL